MPFLPLIPLLASLLSITGIGSLAWYYDKSPSERKKLNQQAANIAKNWFNTNAKNLNISQAQSIFDDIKRLSR